MHSRHSSTEDGGASLSTDPVRVRVALRSLPSGEMANALAETFRCLSDPTRLRIVIALAGQELSVNELAAVLGLTGSAVSHQLRLLRGQRLVKYRKHGKASFYMLDDPHISNLIAEGVRHVGSP